MTFEEKQEIEKRIGTGCPFLTHRQIEGLDPVGYEKMLITIRDGFDKFFEMGNCDDDDDI